MRLSILIPSIPSRFAMAEKLYNHLLSLVGDRDIEVLLLMDNKKRSIGAKREAVKKTAKGKYFMFCDDDDWIETIDEVYEATKKDVDVITFKVLCKNNSGSEFTVTFGLGNEVEHLSDGNGNYLDLKRPPFHTCAWHRKFKSIKFPDISYGEDWGWVQQALKTAKKEIHIDKVIHKYNYDPEISEAPLENTIKAIVNFSSDAYLLGQARLMSSLVNLKLFYLSLYQYNYENLTVPDHSENPYAFKVISIDYAHTMGYNQVLWLDASVYAVKDISPVFDWITKNGFFLEDSGHMVGEWCNDRTLEYYGITRDEAMQMPMISSGFVGIDFNNPVGIELFEKWKKAMEDGMFVGSWDDHRHDQTCLSIAACQMGLENLISPCGQFFAYIGEVFGPPKETAVCHLQGIR